MPTSSSRRAPFVALTASVALGIALFFSLYSLIPVTRAENPELGSLFVGTLMACVLAVQVFAPMLVRRLSLKWVLAGAATLLGCGALLAGIADAVPALLAGAVAGGLGFGVLIVVGAQGVALLVPAGRLGRALGLYGVITVSSSAFGSAAGLQLALALGPAVFGIAGAVAGLASAAFALALPAGVGRSAAAGAASGARRLARSFAKNVPWAVLLMLLLAVMLLSHGLTSVPAVAAPVNGALVILLVQIGNAAGRWLGAELEERLSPALAALIGSIAAAGAAAATVLVPDAAGVAVAAALVGAGVGVVQGVSLHAAMRVMTAGSASVVWNLTFDSGLWIGGVLWGLLLASGRLSPAVVAIAAACLIAGAVASWRMRARPDGLR